ncbi:MAG: DUF1573 domain-containing protein [Prolixibacteraceae bacterium]|jgi:hypothetical protein
MNKQITILILFLFVACSPAVPRNDASLSFSNNKHDFGTISLKNEATFSFEFINHGKTPLVINEVKTSCGCTVPDWPKKPIKPGKKGEIKIKYDAAFPGVFHKTIEVFYNGKDSPQTLNIKGEVEYPDDLEATIK